MTGGINQALANITLLDDYSYTTGSCGKAEPVYYPNSKVNSEIAVSQLARSQLWRGQQVHPQPIQNHHLTSENARYPLGSLMRIRWQTQSFIAL
ncbi:MAG: hypothetical protein ACQESG_05590 [Nanobdellota archaeon]